MPRYLALGDSYTIGEGVEEHERWPNVLVRRLRDRGIEIDDAQIIARTAWSSDELFDVMAAERLKPTYQLVTLLVGVNDQYRSRPVASFALEFLRIVRRTVTLTGGKGQRVIVLSIPDWSATPYAERQDRDRIAQEIAHYNASAKEIAVGAGTQWVDVTSASRAMLSDPTLVASDGLHPSGALYAQWAELVEPAAVDALAATRKATRTV